MRKFTYTFFSSLLVIIVLMTNCKETNEHNNREDRSVNWNQEDYQLVKSAILNYVDGLYLVDSTRIQKSVDTTLRKIGYWYDPKTNNFRDHLPMTYKQLVSLAARWNRDGNRVTENSPKEIEIYDINSKSASAKLTAEWGIDYFHLAKYDGQWKIMNVLWQSMPEEEQ